MKGKLNELICKSSRPLKILGSRGYNDTVMFKLQYQYMYSKHVCTAIILHLGCCSETGQVFLFLFQSKAQEVCIKLTGDYEQKLETVSQHKLYIKIINIHVARANGPEWYMI